MPLPIHLPGHKKRQEERETCRQREEAARDAETEAEKADKEIIEEYEAKQVKYAEIRRQNEELRVWTVMRREAQKATPYEEIKRESEEARVSTLVRREAQKVRADMEWEIQRGIQREREEVRFNEIVSEMGRREGGR